MIAGLGSLLLAITQVGQGAAWNDPSLLGLFAGALLLLLLFVWHERRTGEPLVPMHLFAIRAATLSWLVGFFASFQSISLSVLVPLRFQSVTGAGADSAAVHLLPLAMGVPLGAYCCGRLTATIGRYKPQIVGGALLLPCAIAGLALTPPQSMLLSGLFMLPAGSPPAPSSRPAWWPRRAPWNRITWASRPAPPPCSAPSAVRSGSP
jgi:hypothetical protein